MKQVIAQLTDPNTGATGTTDMEYPNDYPRHSIIYHWTEGNYGCDCNRSLFLFNLEYDDAWPCGETIVLDSLTVNGDPLDIST